MSRTTSHASRAGFTLVEITFSIAFMTMILVAVLGGFIGIFGLYNRAQGLTRTSEDARNALDTLVRDLRQTTEVNYFATKPGNIRHFYCLSNDAREIGYGLLFKPSTGRFHLTRFAGSGGTSGCTDLTSSREQLVGDDLWSDRVNNPPASEDLPPEFQSIVIERVAPVNIMPPGSVVWQARIGVHRGSRVPGRNQPQFLADQFSASTALQAIVSVRR